VSGRIVKIAILPSVLTLDTVAETRHFNKPVPSQVFFKPDRLFI
jgi:hypothetical protein